jgi:hypothetical protein
METEPIIESYINISYETDAVSVSFDVEFGKGVDSYDMTSYERTKYKRPYDIEVFEIDNKKMYRLLAEEGPIVVNITNVFVKSNTNKNKVLTSYGYILYEYGISMVLDMNKEPVYDDPRSFTPSNDVERDGISWVVKNYKTLKVDQNGKGKYQWSTAKALDKGVKPTPEQEEMGVEERHENSGMLYITFQPIYTEEIVYEEKEVTRGGGATRGLTRGLTRGFGGNNEDGEVMRSIKSSAARVGYGSKVETKSKDTTVTSIANSRYILPIRVRIIGDVSGNTKCAKDLKSALRVEELQNKTGIIPDY